MRNIKKNTAPLRQDVPAANPDPELGLSEEEVSLRQSSGWSNGLVQSAARTEREIVLEKLLTFFNLVFVILAAFLALTGSSVKNMTFLIVVVCNIAIGIFQEIRAKRTVDRLTLVAAAQLKTVRGGEVMRIRSDALVRDDIVEFSTGDQICADGILRTGTLYVNEALITGEEDPVFKTAGDMLRSGSFVIAGTGRVQLTYVGADSFAARLAAEAKNGAKAAKSEMMRALDRLIQVVGIVLIPVGLFLFYQEFKILNSSLTDSAEATVAALVGMIPEGLYLLTSVAMAVSATTLTRQKVLVQDMNCIEALARVDVLCVDKTGTITEAKMEVDNVLPLTDDSPERLESILSAIYSSCEPENDTARAMEEMFATGSDWVCTHRIPFTSATKWSAAVFRGQGTFIVGAPDSVMADRYAQLQETVEDWSCRGYRVLLIAQYAGEPDTYLESGKLRPLALVLLTNRIRPEAKETFAYFAKQGVCVKVISGDNPITVSEVARRAGIADADRCIDASALDTDSDFLQAVTQYTVFGRVTPDQKKRLILAYRKLGHTVAMTGDGVNDVLAMKEANCSVAMASGAQAASQVAKLVLLESDFSAMPDIVAEGRRVINNIQRAASLFLVKNIFSLGLSLVSVFTGWGYPLVPIHMTMISALTIGIPSFFLALEPNYERVKGKFLPTVLRRALPGGITNILAVLMAQAFGVIFGLQETEAATVCVGVLSVVGLLVLFEACKPFDKFRALLWGFLAAGIALCFTMLRSLFELQAADMRTLLVMAALMLMTPTVFFAMQRLFDWGDKLVALLRRRRSK